MRKKKLLWNIPHFRRRLHLFKRQTSSSIAHCLACGYAERWILNINGAKQPPDGLGRGHPRTIHLHKKQLGGPEMPPAHSVCFFILSSQCNEYPEELRVGEKQRTFIKTHLLRVRAGLWLSEEFWVGFIWILGLRVWQDCQARGRVGLQRRHAGWPGASQRTSPWPLSCRCRSHTWLVWVWLQSGFSLQP